MPNQKVRPANDEVEYLLVAPKTSHSDPNELPAKADPKWYFGAGLLCLFCALAIIAVVLGFVKYQLR